MINYLFNQYIPYTNSTILLIMIRIFFILAYSKIFHYTNIRLSIKMLLVYLISYLLEPFVSNNNISDIYHIDFFIIMCNQILIGMIMGWLFQCVFSCIIFIGEIISAQIGLSFSVFFDFGHHIYSLVISQLLSIFFLLLFFAHNGHLKFIIFIINSFNVLPLNDIFIYRNIFLSIINFSSLIFINGVYCVLPILFFFLILYIACMLLNRILPNVSLFSSFSVIIFVVGLILFKYFIFRFYWISTILIKNFFHYLKIYIIKLLYH
ncbi:Flagellar biosynthetic protein FliR [Buchnera aphidicola (Cinara pseudotaxifoliae)]|uniref:Flagellar biosynthetic protein FliR n=1 Tax=Buchnera aphidicola (Cinara pseudotaxifoliae) TaxID=655384 RepID=A0A451DG90_9GAMM|nr:flagellar biosynthetic protein FliR [Buchnera aphidicola]VFP85636.1 Flagellar biosynthetic protein FliR [Buchnera aphidicola (Cinara pseudotaxifoliae)]